MTGTRNVRFPGRVLDHLGSMESVTDAGHCPDWLESCLSNDSKPEIDELDGVGTFKSNLDQSPEERKGTYCRLRNASKPHSTPLTLKWLEENYEIAEGVCIPRSTLYVHYLDFCEHHDTQPVNAASFGKIIRQQFPQLTTRRLGTRGQSKYHYYGIGVRETSKYYELMYSAKGVQSSLGDKKDTSKQIIAYSPRSKLGTLLPDFPGIRDIKLPPTVAEDKVLTFLMMYRTHCQRILDTVIRANFDEVQSFLLHFWQGMPNHIKSILDCKVLVILVGVCDSILYRAIASVLMPTVLQPLPESLTQVIRRFSGQLDDWLHQALDSLPQSLQKVKFDLARRFSQVLRRQTSLNHLCQAARTVIHSAEITSQMLEDWINVDLNSIIKQTLYTMDSYSDREHNVIVKSRTVIHSAEITSQMLEDWINVDLNSIIKQTLYTIDSYSDREHNVIVKLTREFEVLLEDQAPLESYIEWLDSMVDQCVVQKSNKQCGYLRKTARQFLLMWSCFGTRIIRDMTLHSAPSFGSFHLLHLMFDEYVLYMVETLHSQERGNELLRALRGEQTLDFLDDVLLADTTSTTLNSQESDRGSVIRGPNIAAQNQDVFENLADFSCLQPQDQRDSCNPQQSGLYRETTSINSKHNGTYPMTQCLVNSFYNQSGYSQSPARATSNSHQTSVPVRCTTTVHPFLEAAKQAYSCSEATSVSNWCDWSSRSIGCTGVPGHVSNRIPTIEAFDRQTVPSTYQIPQTHAPAAYDNNPGMTNYCQYPNEIVHRRTATVDGTALKRKLDQNVSTLHNKQLDEFYAYSMGSNVL